MYTQYSEHGHGEKMVITSGCGGHLEYPYTYGYCGTPRARRIACSCMHACMPFGSFLDINANVGCMHLHELGAVRASDFPPILPIRNDCAFTFALTTVCIAT